MSKPLSFLLAGLLAACVPSAARAQLGGHDGHGHGGPPGQMGEAQKLMQAQLRVMNAQQQALQDPGIQKELEAVQALVEGAMKKGDKSLAVKIDRFHAIEKQLEGMKEKGDPDPTKIQPLIEEIRGLGMELAQAQQRVLEDPVVRARVEAFDKKVQAKMAEIDPEVPTLIAKLQAGAPAPGGALPAAPPPAAAPALTR